MSNTNSLSDSLGKRVSLFFQRTFIEDKLNNWFGYLLIIAIALGFGYLLSKDFQTGLIVFASIVAIGYVIVSFANSTVAFFTIIVYSFSVELILRLFFGGKFQSGIVYDGLVALTFIGLLITRNDIKQNFKALSKSPVVIFYYINLAYTPIQFFNPNAFSLDTNILALRKFVGYLLVLFIAYILFDSPQKVKQYIRFIFVVTGLCALYGCIQQWHGLFDFELRLIMADPVAFGLTFVNGDFRKFSTLSDASSFGILMAACAVFFIIFFLNEKNKTTRVILGIGCLLMILAMAYSATRTAYAAIIGGMFFYFLLTLEKTQTKIIAAISAVGLAILIWGPFYGNATIYRFRTTFVGAEDESYKVRVTAWNRIQPYIQSHPIGGGLGTSGNEGARNHPGHPLAGFQPDSSYVRRAAETGWIGLALVCLYYFVTLKVGIGNYFSSRNKEIKVVYAACISSFFTFYVAEFAQQAIGGIADTMVYCPFLAIILKLKTYDKGEEIGLQG